MWIFSLLSSLNRRNTFGLISTHFSNLFLLLGYYYLFLCFSTTTVNYFSQFLANTYLQRPLYNTTTKSKNLSVKYGLNVTCWQQQDLQVIMIQIDTVCQNHYKWRHVRVKTKNCKTLTSAVPSDISWFVFLLLCTLRGILSVRFSRWCLKSKGLHFSVLFVCDTINKQFIYANNVYNKNNNNKTVSSS